MIQRLLLASFVLPLVACTSTPAAPELDLDTFTYQVSVPSVPEGVSELALSVDLPPEIARVLSVNGLVGNALFEFPLTESRAASFSNEDVSAHFYTVCHYIYEDRHLRLTTPGKPVELALRLGLPAGFSGTEGLEKSLVASTAALADGKPIEAVAMRLTPVR